jgi:hypothetical protein
MDENRDTMRTEGGGFCLIYMDNLDMNLWNAGGSGADGRYYLGLVCVFGFGTCGVDGGLINDLRVIIIMINDYVSPPASRLLHFNAGVQRYAC